MNKKTIAIDLDNTIWDMSTPWVKIYNRRFNDNVDPDNLPCYNMVNIMTKASVEGIYKILEVPTFWYLPKLMEGAYKYIGKLNEEYDVVIVTRTNYRVCKDKFNRLLELLPFLKHEQIIICFDKSKINYDIVAMDV